MAVLIENRQNRVKLSLKTIRQAALDILNGLGCPEGELSILIVDDSAIGALNEQYLSRKGPTNVIAFPMREGDFSQVTPELLGDVVLSVDTAQKEGVDAGISFDERFLQLLVHGILHLFGYDHENDRAAERRMNAKSDRLMMDLNQDLKTFLDA